MTEIVPQLGQAETWTDRKGVTRPLTEMDPHHRENTVRFLERNAERLHDAEHFGLLASMMGHHGEVAEDLLDTMLIQMEDEDPLVWLSGKPLYQTMRKMVDHDREEGIL